MRVLLVEDQKKLTDALVYLFKKEHIEVDVAHDGETGLELGLKEIYDVIVLDIMLPQISGLEILKKIRENGNLTPVIFLTAKDAIEDRVKGLELGADDYLIKPFATNELIARIRSLARRAARGFDADRLVIGNVIYNYTSHVLNVNNKEHILSAKEGQLLEMLMRRPEQVFTREQILDKIWGYDVDIMINNVEIYIHHLRKKIGDKADIKIKTVRNIGYMLRKVNNV